MPRRSDQWIDVVIPYYGDPDYLRLTVASVLEQDDPAWRLAVVEDGPQRGFDTRSFVESLREPRARYVGSGTRLGVAGNFQRALDLATADHVVFLGCDDVMLPGYVRTVRRLASRYPGAAILQPGVEVIDAQGMPSSPLADRVKSILRPRAAESIELHGEHALARLMHGNWLYFPALCWQRKYIAEHGFRPDLPTALDLELIARVVMDGGTIAYDPTVVFRYRRHASSASSRTASARSRFVEEARVHDEVARRAAVLGWRRARTAARLRPTSRAHHAVVAASRLFRSAG